MDGTRLRHAVWFGCCKSPRKHRWRSAPNTKSGKIREFHGWLLTADGRIVAYPKTAIPDISLASEYTYAEDRARVLLPEVISLLARS